MTHHEAPVDFVFYAGSTLLEGPCWDARNQVIYCISIEQGIIYRIDPVTGLVRSYRTSGLVGCVVVESSGMLLSAEQSGIYRINPASGARNFLIQLEQSPLMRYNDGILDPRGRFLVGTKGRDEEREGQGLVFSYDGSCARVAIRGTTISNGLGFSEDGASLYFIDTPSKKVARYRYDLESGHAEFESYIIELDGPGLPDGLCVDLDGMIWVAEWEGAQVCKWSPITGEKLTSISLPCRRVTSCCLGGPMLNQLFITTAQSDGESGRLGGGLFKVRIR